MSRGQRLRCTRQHQSLDDSIKHTSDTTFSHVKADVIAMKNAVLKLGNLCCTILNPKRKV